MKTVSDKKTRTPRTAREKFDRLSPEKREKILRSAADEFSRRGYEKANTNIIAKKAGISVGALFKYFETKENCFIAVLDDGIRQLEELLKTITASEDPVLNKIGMIVRVIPKHTKTHGEMIRLYYELTGNGGTKRVRELGARMEEISAKAYRKLMKDAKKEGMLSPDADPDVFAFCLDNLFMMMQFSYACGYYEKRREIYLGAKKAKNDRRVTDQMMKFITGALSPRE